MSFKVKHMEATVEYPGELSMYLRFVVGSDSEDHRLLTGVITESRFLRDNGLLQDYETEWLEQQFNWFNTNIPVPPYKQNEWPTNCAAWFKNNESAAEALTRIWEFVNLLRENGKQVRVLRSKMPGYIWYEDDFQIVVTEF
jgi:hypothetical protein